ncbi:hypothetical protein WICMUC_000255 [Wickerhamomyces mucosus]|uniref:DNL-type domain-containing protein n=1 Tax=Wickerhamomyces mucosus TaxID=1378264 RepID=A0A9P8TIY2_9ASCO|nr:hypothetical protein WICMUC_000255 [Wickerhamomyces mucosus]
MISRTFSRQLSNVARRSHFQGTFAMLAHRTTYIPLASPKIRFHSTEPDKTTAQLKTDKPQMMISFKCKKCDTRSSHVMSKQAYTSGTVLITCPGCKNKHLIADHLKVNNRITVQDILAAKGESVSQSTDDLVFDEIPQKLKKLIGHHAPDAPKTSESEKASEEQFILPNNVKKQ